MDDAVLIEGKASGDIRESLTGSRDEWPIAVVQDRYGGCYSGGAWLAISVADRLENGAYRVVRCLEGGPSDGDVEAREFWTDPPSWIAAGTTPDEAVKALLKKTRMQQDREALAELDRKIAEGTADLDAGRTRSIDEVRAAMRTRFGQEVTAAE